MKPIQQAASRKVYLCQIEMQSLYIEMQGLNIEMQGLNIEMQGLNIEMQGLNIESLICSLLKTFR